ncbi:MAG: methyltransferase family protein [Gammaproteobacteria bacterium]
MNVPNNDVDAARVKIPPPLIYLGAVLAGVFLHLFVVPLTMTSVVGVEVRIGLVCLTALFGLVLLGAALGLFRRSGQDPKPWKSTPEIVTSGVYRWTRNPMYLGMAFLQAALGFGLANGWIVLLIAPVLVAIYLIAIRHEEIYLEDKFGASYVEYKASVRRWL